MPGPVDVPVVGRLRFDLLPGYEFEWYATARDMESPSRAVIGELRIDVDMGTGILVVRLGRIAEVLPADEPRLD